MASSFILAALRLAVCLLSLSGIVKSLSVAEKSEAAAVRDIPIIEHEKEPGKGYIEGSPLYAKQQRKYFQQKEDRLDLEKEMRAEKKSHDNQYEQKKAQQGVKDFDFGWGEAPWGQGSAETNSNVDYTKSAFGWRPVSTTMQCVLNLCLQYFLIYSCLALVRMYHMLVDSAGSETPSPALKTLESATATVNYAPMLCVLFLSTRMRAIQLTQGRTDEFMLPPPWVQFCMRACAWAVMMQLVIVLAIPLMTGKPAVTDHDGNVEVHRVNQGACSVLCVILRYIIMLGLYLGFMGVCIGVHQMEAPKEVYPDGTPPVSPAVHCVIILSTVYFCVYFVLAVFRTINQMNGYSHTKASDTFQLAAYTVNFSPMLCILFIAARMRALQMDPRHGNPQRWAQQCMYLCTASVVLQTMLVITVPFCLGGKARKGPSEGDITFEIRNTCCNNFLLLIRWIAILCLYGGFTVVIYSVLTIEHPKGPQATPEVSPTLQCVIILTVQFFLVYLLLWIAITLNQMSSQRDEQSPPSQRNRVQRNILIATLDSGRTIVMFCPMLAILFVACRMRALQLTANKGAPAGWAQDCMYIATFSSVGQLIVVILIGLQSELTESQRRKSRADDNDDEEGPRTGRDDKTCVAFAEGIQMLFHITMYVGAIGVAYFLVTMRPEDCTGRGSQLPKLTHGKEQEFPE
eukprot:gnl/MRDRNA2_/MRDRNA2_78400_c0_seq1.p1 gnl/MRDRNA2_/MRDRNA2_78400_c0~~gnl/MRDRNA2_/MRDRNA2_78400_c0_seq1.p1  ORF type:complete len:685 (+),score=107.64 gnl/MRDRNA2_/MRDRNA2_78400_c0_seq1:172-2226(+)